MATTTKTLDQLQLSDDTYAHTVVAKLRTAQARLTVFLVHVFGTGGTLLSRAIAAFFCAVHVLSSIYCYGQQGGSTSFLAPVAV